MPNVQLIHVGLGNWGTQWAQEVLPVLEGADIVAYVDTNPAALARMEAAGTPAGLLFSSLADALATTKAEGVIVAVRTQVHHTVVTQALRAGRHVLVEKPFTTTVEEAQDLVALAEQQDRLLFVSQNYRFFPTPNAVAALVRDRVYGGPLTVEIDFRRYIPAGHVYPTDPYPLLVDMAIHHFDMMRFILGEEPVEVSCRTWNPSRGVYLGAPCAALTASFDKGTTVTWRGNYLSRGTVTPWSGEWRLDLDGASLAFTCRGDAPDRLAAEKLVVMPIGEAPIDLTTPSSGPVDRLGTATAFVESIRAGKPVAPLPTGADNLVSLAFCLAAVRSAEANGAPVRIADMSHKG